jgi:hypothetical protein
MKTITLRYEATCRECGTRLPAGCKARWYGRGRVYGIGCHERTATGERTAFEAGDNSPGAIASHYDRRGVYTVDGRMIGTSGPRCEDAPCCGCCT